MSAEFGKGQRSYLQIGSLGHVLKEKVLLKVSHQAPAKGKII